MTDMEQLADKHWSWLVVLLEYVYKTAFTHGFKHGVDSEKLREKE